jgi:hypothetical protein
MEYIIYISIKINNHLVEFFCVYCKTRKKVDKFIKVNRIKNKYIIDIKKIMEEEEVSFEDDRMYLKVLIFQKIQQAIDKKKDIYYIPDFENEFSIEKLLNLKKILGENNFNVLIFYNEFRKNPEIIDDVFSNLSKFSNSQIIRDY